MRSIRNILNSRLRRYEYWRLSHVCILKTIFFNFRYLPFKTAIKLPVWVYNNVNIVGVKHIKIDGFIHGGMIRIGNCPEKAKGKTKIIGNGLFVFNGNADIWGGSVIECQGTLEVGNNVRIAENNYIMCVEKVKICDCTAIGYDTAIMDTDYHFVLNTSNNHVKRNTKNVIIASGSWVSSNCKILKGARLPQNSIVSTYSVVNRDYSKELPGQLYGGIPAKPIKKYVRRIFNTKEEDQLMKYFREHPEDDEYPVNIKMDIDHFCVDNFFRDRN